MSHVRLMLPSETREKLRIEADVSIENTLY